MKQRIQFLQNVKFQIESRFLPEDNIYQNVYATYFRGKRRLGADVNKASAAIRLISAKLTAEQRNNYDLLVLGKEGDKIRVRNVLGQEGEYSDYVTNSYNDLDSVQEVKDQLIDYIRSSPISSCLSRKIAGRLEIHDRLEREISDFLGYDGAVLGTCGYITQMSTISALMDKFDVIFSDQFNHSSLIDGCKLAGAKVFVYKHLDYAHLESLLKKHRHRFNAAMVLSDGVFSAKGTRADMDKLVPLAKQYNCISTVDDTHGIAVIGKNGRGCIDFGSHKPDVLTGGFSKALGAFGGFVVANQNILAALNLMGFQNINTSHLSPLAAAQSYYNLIHYRKNLSSIQSELFHKCERLNTALAAKGKAYYPTDGSYSHPIFAFSCKLEADTLSCMRTFMTHGVLPSFFPYPVCPLPTLRFSLHRLSSDESLQTIADLISQLGMKPANQ